MRLCSGIVGEVLLVGLLALPLAVVDDEVVDVVVREGFGSAVLHARA